MLGRIWLISTGALIAATLTAAGQQLPQEPRGENPSTRATPSEPPPSPDATTGQRSATPPGKTGPGGQSTPQEPRGEDTSRSANPSGQFLPPNPNEPRK
jgi:hypothetical protein